MKHMLFVAVAALALSATPAFAGQAGQHPTADHGQFVTAGSGGGNGGSDRKAVEQAEAGGGSGGSDRRAVEQA